MVGPGTEEIDLSLFKNIPIKFRKGTRLEFRAEAFNLFNKPQFDNPGENGASSGGGSIGLPTSGTLNYAGNPAFFQRASREIQLALKLYFQYRSGERLPLPYTRLQARFFGLNG